MPRRSVKHLTPEWQRVRNKVKPRLLARLPHPCPRCGNPMTKGQRLDVGHISRTPGLEYAEQNLRLEHTSCNRRDGQRITTALRMGKTTGERMPRW